MAWFDKTGPESDVVISSRIRFARNLAAYPFPSRLDEAGRRALIGKVSSALAGLELTVTELGELSVPAVRSLVEKHYISPNFAGETAPHALLLNEEKQIAVMVLEEDHVRIQTLEPGLALDKAFERACVIDTALDEGCELAYHEKLGYLTGCPTNLGTAMRASVMVHLPALTMAGKIGPLTRNLSKLGMTVRGLYGEGSEAAAALYQVSNSVTMGLSETEILGKLHDIVLQLAESERKLRQSMKSDGYARLCDKVMRAFGTLKNAYMMSSEEFLGLWSDTRLGVSLGILKDVSLETLGGLLVGAMPATLAIECGSEASDAAGRDIARAEKMRRTLGAQ